MTHLSSIKYPLRCEELRLLWSSEQSHFVSNVTLILWRILKGSLSDMDSMGHNQVDVSADDFLWCGEKW